MRIGVGIIDLNDTEHNLDKIKNTDNYDDESFVDKSTPSIDDFNIELHEDESVKTIKEMSEEERKKFEKMEEERIRRELEKELKRKEDEKSEEVLEQSALEKIIAKFRGDNTSNDAKVEIVEMDPDELKKHGYPKKVYDPTDVEYDDDGNPQYFFNIKKTLTKHNLLWIMKIVGEERLVALTYDDDFLDSYADKQHRRAFNYNNMTPTEQFLYDRKKRIKKVGFSLFFIAILVAFILFNRIPQNKIKKAENLYLAGKYEEAYEAYRGIKSQEAEEYAMLSYIKMCINNNNFDEAREVAKELAEQDLKISNNELINFTNEIDYAEALKKYKEKKYNDAAKLFKNILGYKESLDYYNKSIYLIGEENFDNGNVIEALESFYSIPDYSDAKDRFNKIADSEYTNAMNLYNKKEYKKAANKFKELAQFNFKDSDSMVYQCTYKKGLDAFLNKNYDEAIKTLSQNLNYKDSRTIVNESIYNKANDLLLSSPAKANIEFSKIYGYRDADKILRLPLINLYGEWEIFKADDRTVEPEKFVFSVNRKILSNKPIRNIRVSTPGDDVSYNWDNGEKFVTEDELSSLEVTAVDNDEIILKATDQGETTIYNCRKVNSLYKYMGLDKKIDKVEKDDEVIDNDFFDYLLEKYIN